MYASFFMMALDGRWIRIGGVGTRGLHRWDVSSTPEWDTREAPIIDSLCW